MTSKLAEAVKNEFNPRVCSHGEAYLALNAVRIRQCDHRTVSAVVSGRELYIVSLHLVDNELVVDCNCPHFVDGPCKHVWATVLAADAKGCLSPPAGTRRLTFKMSDEYFDD